MEKTKWEYKTIKLNANKGFMGGKTNVDEINMRLNELGDDKWELATSFTTQMGYGSSRDVILILKKPRLR